MLLYGIGLDATELCPLLKISSNKTTVDRKYQTNVIKSKKMKFYQKSRACNKTQVFQIAFLLTM